MRSDWSGLPREIRDEITAHTGRIDRMEPAPTGNHADLASTLYTADGSVFVKAARKQGEQDGPEVRSLRWEAAINPHVNEFAPRLLWQAEAGGWLALGFEYVRGRHADYAPGSPDLDLLAKVIEALQGLEAPEVLARKRVERRWESMADDVSALAGHTLLHSDLNSANLLITPDGRVRVVDWAFVARGAAFVELALLVPWLLKAGHSPTQAEAWVSRFPSWADADSSHIDLFARVFADKWRANLAQHWNNAAWAIEHAAAAQRWAVYRSG